MFIEQLSSADFSLHFRHWVIIVTNQPRSQFGSRTLFVLMFVGVIGALSVRKYGAEALPWIMTIVLGVGLAMVGRWLVAGVQMAQDDPTRPMKVETFNDNYQASLLVSRLEDSGIKATAVGGFVSGFQAESPGYVDVVVPQSELARAKSLYEQWKTESIKH